VFAARPIEDDETLARVLQGGADPAQAVIRLGIGVGRATVHAAAA
jgi:hypothetical protein